MQDNPFDQQPSVIAEPLERVLPEWMSPAELDDYVHWLETQTEPFYSSIKR